MRAGVSLLLFVLPLAAQPVIYPGGVVNAAGYLPSSTPGGAIAEGSVFSIFGAGLGPPAPGVQVTRFPLGTTLGGVTIRLTHQSGTVLDALPLFVSDSQINAILPSSAPVGAVLVTVQYNGRATGPERIKVVRSSFGIFTRESSGSGPAIAQNFVSATELPLNSPARPARPGQTVVLWGTGLGPIAGADSVSPTPGNLNEPFELTLGGRLVSIDYHGRSGCCAGVDQINFRVPADAPTGCAVPLSVKLQNGVFGNLATIAISPDGGPCQDALNPPGAARRWAEISLARSMLRDPLADLFSAIFREGDPRAPFPVPGLCTSRQPVIPAPVALNAGPQLTLTGPQGSIRIGRDGAGLYQLTSPPNSFFLGPGSYALSGPGGSDVGSFEVSLISAPTLTWTTSTGSRTTGLTVAWTGGDPQRDFALISSETFVCTASVQPASFTVPPPVLANLPSQALIQVGSVLKAAFTASGLDAGIVTYAQTTARTISLGDPPLASSPVLLPNGQRILAELAATNPEQERGLMARTELAPDRGMLFLFNRPQPQLLFWMFQTLIPLDIIWTDQDRRIVFISANTPPCPDANSDRCPTYGPAQSSQYVLEIAAGRAAALGLKLGDALNW